MPESPFATQSIIQQYSPLDSSPLKLKTQNRNNPFDCESIPLYIYFRYTKQIANLLGPSQRSFGWRETVDIPSHSQSLYQITNETRSYSDSDFYRFVLFHIFCLCCVTRFSFPNVKHTLLVYHNSYVGDDEHCANAFSLTLCVRPSITSGLVLLRLFG